MKKQEKLNGYIDKGLRMFKVGLLGLLIYSFSFQVCMASEDKNNSDFMMNKKFVRDIDLIESELKKTDINFLFWTVFDDFECAFLCLKVAFAVREFSKNLRQDEIQKFQLCLDDTFETHKEHCNELLNLAEGMMKDHITIMEMSEIQKSLRDEKINK